MTLPRSAQPLEQSRTDFLFAIIVTVAYALVTGAFMVHHVMWRDEWHYWMVAREATSLFDLWHNTRTNGHPGLWPLMLFTLSRFSRNPALMQVLHLILAVTGVFIFLGFARLPRIHKVLYTFGFFPFYQYAIISRCYSLGILLVMGYCALVSFERHRGLLGALVLALLANASAYGWLLAFALGAVLLVPEALRAPRTLRRLIPIAILLCGMMISIALMYPSVDTKNAGIREGILSGNVLWSWEKAVEVVSGVGKAYLSRVMKMFWGELLTLSVLCAAFFAFAFARQRAVLTVYLISLISMVVFKYLIYMGFWWHDGHFLIALIACWWLYSSLPQRALSWQPLDSVSRACNWLLPGVIAVFLVLHFILAGFSFLHEWKTPNSGSKAVAQFLTNNELRDSEILGDGDLAVSSVSGYLDRPIYYLISESWGTFCRFNTQRRDMKENSNQEELQRRIHRFATRGNGSVLVLNYELIPPASAALGSRLLYTSPPAIYDDERFWVYDLPRSAVP
jgi:hypothetical protein